MRKKIAEELGRVLLRQYRLCEYDFAVDAIYNAELGIPDMPIGRVEGPERIITAGEYLTRRGLWNLVKEKED